MFQESEFSDDRERPPLLGPEAIFGLVVGLAASVETGHLMRDLPYEIKPLDALVYATVAATLLAVAALACIVPARRASRLDPMQGLSLNKLIFPAICRRHSQLNGLVS